MAERDRQVVSVVDDDESLRRSLGNLFRSVGFASRTFASADEFLRSAQRANTSCLVLDLRMNGMSGSTCSGIWRPERPRIPVVILTAHGDEETRRRSLEARCDRVPRQAFSRSCAAGGCTGALR